MSRKTADTYMASVTRLKALVGRLEGAQVDVDELESVVKESVELVTVCRTRLRATQMSVDTLLAGLQDDAAATMPQQTVAVPVVVPAPKPAAVPVVPAAASVTVEDDFDPFADD